MFKQRREESTVCNLNCLVESQAAGCWEYLHIFNPHFSKMTVFSFFLAVYISGGNKTVKLRMHHWRILIWVCLLHSPTNHDIYASHPWLLLQRVKSTFKSISHKKYCNILVFVCKGLTFQMDIHYYTFTVLILSYIYLHLNVNMSVPN